VLRLCVTAMCVALATSACPSCEAPPTDGGVVDDSGVADDDSGIIEDAGGVSDAGSQDAGFVRDAGDVVDAGSSEDAGATDAGGVDDAGAPPDAGPVVDAGARADAGLADRPYLRVMTFNTGTAPELDHDDGDAYTQAEAGIGDEHYGNGLAWRAAITQTQPFFADTQPDVVAFQEIFHPGDCAMISSGFHVGFICEVWQDGDATVAQMLVGDGYQVACHLDKNDKCVAVRRARASIRGCDGDLCLNGLDGVPIPNCGGGSRVGRAVLDLVEGGSITVVSVHGTSGLSDDDIQCRENQIEQIFTDFDGEPAANGERNIVLGDFNTDPGRAEFVDNSADRWTDKVGGSNDFQFISDVGFGAEASYSGLSIDHVVSDVFTGSCVIPGETPGTQPVLDMVYFDHKPVVCDIDAPGP